jgi:hypothetical protein
MSQLRILVAVLGLVVAGAAHPQSGERGSVPPGQSRDGSAPAEGAIKGGTIQPGETAGVPEKRCDELSGSLREDCLKQRREGAAGATKLPSDTRKKSPVPAD